MTKTIRAALVAAVSTLALVFAGSALASFAPKITITNASTAAGGGAGVTISPALAARPLRSPPVRSLP